MKTNINKLISEYLINSYIYYEKGESIIQDSEYDEICIELLERFEEIETCSHPHKQLIDKNSLEATTGYDLVGLFPLIVQTAGNQLIYEKNNPKKIEKVIEQKRSNLGDLF